MGIITILVTGPGAGADRRRGRRYNDIVEGMTGIVTMTVTATTGMNVTVTAFRGASGFLRVPAIARRLAPCLAGRLVRPWDRRSALEKTNRLPSQREQS